MKYLFSKLSFGFFINICLFFCLNCSQQHKVIATPVDVGVASNDCLAHMRFTSRALSKKTPIDILASVQQLEGKINSLESLVKNCNDLDLEDRQSYLDDIRENRKACIAVKQKYVKDEKEKKEKPAQLIKRSQTSEEKFRREEEFQRKYVKDLASSFTSRFKELFTRNFLVVSGGEMRWERRNSLDQIFQAADLKPQTSQLIKGDQTNK